MNSKLKQIPFYKSPIIVIMLVLFFSLVFATGYRILIAIDTHPGMVSEDPFEQGENYSSVLANKQKQIEAGYRLSIQTPKTITHNLAQNYLVKITKKDIAVSRVKVVAYLYRSANKAADFQVTLTEVDSGIYQAKFALPLKGRWDLIIEATKNQYLQRKSNKLFAYDK